MGTIKNFCLNTLSFLIATGALYLIAKGFVFIVEGIFNLIF